MNRQIVSLNYSFAIHELGGYRQTRLPRGQFGIFMGSIAQRLIANWQAILDENLAVMSENGLWGVPNFRVTGGGVAESFSCWGQDWLWRVEAEINRRMSAN